MKAGIVLLLAISVCSMLVIRVSPKDTRISDQSFMDTFKLAIVQMKVEAGSRDANLAPAAW